MTIPVTIVVGYSPAALNSLQQLRPEGSVLLIEEPDVIRKRGLNAAVESHSVVRALHAFPYQLAGAAGQFHGEHADLDVISVVPIVEYATPFAAQLAELYGRPGATAAASVILRNKDRLREVTRAAGILNPRSVAVTSFEDVQAAVDTFGLPCIIKPANRQGSVGTVIVRRAGDLPAAWAASQVRDEGMMVPDRPFDQVTLVEEFVDGPEFSVEALVRGGEFLFQNVTGKDLFDGVNPVERGHLVPAAIDAPLTGRLIEDTRRVIQAAGFHTGIVHCEWKVRDGQPYLIECAGRFAGDGIIDLIERAYAFDLVGAYHALMRGEHPGPLPAAPVKAALVHFLGGHDGLVSSIRVDEAALERSGVAAHYLTTQVGARAFTPSMSWHRLGALTVEAPSAAEAQARARAALSAIDITITPDQPA